jgi:acyl-CoA thioester hydrolase
MLVVSGGLDVASPLSHCDYRVIYGDTDQMGVVYYANYLVFFERGRCEYMRERGFDYAGFERAGFSFPVVDAACRYRQPARFGDLLTIETQLAEATRVTLSFGYRILRSDELLATGQTKHACLSRVGKPVRLPAVLRPLLPAEFHCHLARSDVERNVENT